MAAREYARSISNRCISVKRSHSNPLRADSTAGSTGNTHGVIAVPAPAIRAKSSSSAIATNDYAPGLPKH